MASSLIPRPLNQTGNETTSHPVPQLHIRMYTMLYTFTVDGLSVDWVNGKLYWTDATLQHIKVYDTTTGNRRVLIRTGNTTNPRAIVVDPSTR